MKSTSNTPKVNKKKMNIRKIILNDNLVHSRVFDTRKPSKSKTERNINYEEIQTAQPPLHPLTPSPLLFFFFFFFHVVDVSQIACAPESQH